jgi:hypothetical protein
MVKQYGGNGYAFQTCATPLFAEILTTNHIRNKMATPRRESEGRLQSDAREVLRRVYDYLVKGSIHYFSRRNFM